MNPAPPFAVALGVMLLIGGAALSLGRALGRDDRPDARRSASTPSFLAGLPRARLVAGGVVAVVVLLASGWVLLAVLIGALVALWGRLLHDDRADEERRRVEGIAKWLEDLRDTLRGSSMGAEEALERVAIHPPEAIAAPLHEFAHRRRQGFRTDDALDDLADGLAHPISDAAIAAIRLVIGGATGAGRLHGTVQALAAAARDEVTARERIDRTRAVYQGSMRRLVFIGCALVAYLKVAGGELLQPYSTPAGQMVLALPLLMWVGCVMWLRSLCRYELPARGRRDVPRTEVAR